MTKMQLLMGHDGHEWLPYTSIPAGDDYQRYLTKSLGVPPTVARNTGMYELIEFQDGPYNYFMVVEVDLPELPTP
jgi:hypothetical protein